MLVRPLVAALMIAAGSASALAQGTLRIGMTAADIPLTTGQTDQGGEGMRFMGYTVYDGLINWDLSSADKPSGLTPGLATAWKIDDSDKTRWVFKLREGVKFHDGSDFKADAVVWNLDKLLNDKAPQFDPKQAAQGRSRIPAVKSYKVLDDYTLEIRTNTPDAFLPYQIGWVMMSSPAQWEKVGKDWNKFAQTPSGTGPWKLTTFVPQTRAELVPNKDYWDKARAEARQAGAAAAAGSHHPHRRATLGPGRLDRGAVAGRRAEPREGRLQDRHQRLSAQLDVASQPDRRLAVERHPRAQGGQPRDRPQRPESDAGRADDSGQGLRRPGQPVVRQSVVRRQVRSRGGEEAAGRGGLRARASR